MIKRFFKNRLFIFTVLITIGFLFLVFHSKALILKAQTENIDVEVEVVDSISPDDITNLTLTPGYGLINVSWTPSLSPDLATQHIYLSSDGGIIWILVGTVTANINTLTITGLPYNFINYQVRIDSEDINNNLTTGTPGNTYTTGGGGGGGGGGNIETEDPENISPTSSIEPVAAILTTNSITLNFIADDEDGVVEFINLYLSYNNGPYNLIPGDITTSPIILTNLQEGLYKIYSIATDDQGASEEPPTEPDITFTIDFTPPSGLTVEASPSFTNGQTSILTITGDNPENIAQIFITGAVSGDFTNIWLDYTGTTYPITLQPGDGEKLIQVKARDYAENETEFITTTVVIDTTPPPIPDINYPAQIIDRKVTIQIISWPPEVNTITITGFPLVNNQNTFVPLNLSTSIPIGLDLVLTGAYGFKDIVITATDLAGNSAAITIQIEYIEIPLAPLCGDGILHPNQNEECDDGNNINGDGCNFTCQIERPAICGNGIINPGEQCDDSNTINGDGCNSVCQIEGAGACGNGQINIGEQCDDGNTRAGDGCTATCQIERPAICGDFIVQTILGEECDDGNTEPEDGCDENCLFEMIHPALEKIDTDQDGLSDEDEELFETDPNDADSDGDGLTDGEEIFDFQTNPNLLDTDGDGLNDRVETTILFTNPLVSDTDNDCFHDLIENNFGTSPTNSNSIPADDNHNCIPDEQEESTIGQIDLDEDGLGENMEYIYGTDPNNPDTDGDGLTDGEEILEYGTDPLDPNSNLKNLKTKIINFRDGDITGDENPLIRGVIRTGDIIKVFSYDKNHHKIMLCETTPDDQNKFICDPQISLDSGVYDLQIETYDHAGNFIDKSPKVKIIIDLSLTLPPPDVEAINEQPIVHPILKDVKVIVNNRKPTVIGNTIYGSQVFATFKSLITTASLIADSPEGNFRITSPQALDYGPHEVFVYAITADGIRSQDVVVPFEIALAEDELLSFDIVYLLIIASMISMVIAEQKKEQRKLQKQKLNSSNQNSVK